MATIAGHLTKLQAVNRILASIGERPVNSLASGLPDAEIAEALLDMESRQVQVIGWTTNERRSVVLTKNNDDQFALPDNTLQVDTVNPNYGHRTSSPSPSRHINAVMKRSSDDTKWLLFDANNDSETWDSETSLTVDIVQVIDFANLPPAIQFYVFTSAAHKFQKENMGSQVLYQFTKEDVDEAMAMAVNTDLADEDVNMLRDNYHLRSITYRHNPYAS